MGGLSSAEFYLEAAVIFLAAAFVGGFVALIWMKPFELLFTTVHELGHLFAKLLTDGKVKGFEVYFKSKNGTLGLTKVPTDGEDEKTIKKKLRLFFSAGYMGTALFTTGLILLTGFPYLAPYTITFLAMIFAISTFGFGKTFSTFIIGFGMAIFFIWVAWFLPLIGSVFLLYIMAVMGIITAFRDRKTITSLARNEPDGSHDAAQMAKLSKRSALFWARVWSLSTFLMIIIAVGLIWLRPLLGFLEVSSKAVVKTF
jgi:MFS family permease